MAIRFMLNIPVRALQRSIAFWQGLGFALHPVFQSDDAAAVMLSDDVAVMLHVDHSFVHNTDRVITDPQTSTESIGSFALPTRAAVDELMTAALRLGAREFGHGADHGFIYHRSFVDLDGHQWEPYWMEDN